jgi:translocation and assembly module TamA
MKLATRRLAAALCWSVCSVSAWAATSEAASATATPRSRVPRLNVEAPEALKALLLRYSDLARAAALADAADISDAEWSRLIGSAAAQAETLARTEGYFSAKAQVSVDVDPVAADRADAPVPQVHLRVDTGPQATIGRVTLELQGELSELADQGQPEASAVRSGVNQQWPLTQGAAFSGNAWDRAKNGVLAQLRAAGYVAATWIGTAAEVDAEANRVRLVVVADSGPLYRAGRLEVSGVVHQDTQNVRDLAGFKPGDALTELRLQEYQERIGKTGLFDQATISIEPDPAQASQATVFVAVRETPLQSATSGVGVSATTGPRVSFEHINRRVFGFAATSRAKVELGRDKQAWDLELSSHADQDLRRWIVGASEDRLLTSLDMVLSQRLRLGRSQEKPSLERLNFGEFERAQECARDANKFVDCATLRAVSLNTHSTWRRVDSVLLPTVGTTIATQVGIGRADGSASATGAFARLYTRAVAYVPLGSWYTQGRVELGKVFTPAGVQVPDSQRFRAGGDNSVRGYAWRTLAPVTADGATTGGRLLFTGSLEAAHPLLASQPAFWGAVFIDAGRAADQLSELSPAWGYGLGLRWRSPVGPLSLDWAWGQEVHRGRLHLNVGVVF